MALAVFDESVEFVAVAVIVYEFGAAPIAEVTVKVELPAWAGLRVRDVGLKTPVQPAGMVEARLKVALLQPAVSWLVTENV